MIIKAFFTFVLLSFWLAGMLHIYYTIYKPRTRHFKKNFNSLDFVGGGVPL